MNRLINLFAFLGLLHATSLNAQLPAACNGTGSAIICEQACISCNFDGYVGSTQGYPSGPATAFCGTVENAQWMGFIAGTAKATFTVTPGDCNDGNGVQIALYGDCTLPPIACDKGKEDGGLTPVSITVDLTPGHNYFLLIDGYAGDQCDFSVDVSPKEAVYEPPLGMVQAIQGKTEGCPGATFTYAVPPVFGAAAYIWDGPPGTLVDSMPVPATILGTGGNTVEVTLGDQSGNLCVQAVNSCEANPPCASSLFITVLDDSYRPELIADSVGHLSCTESPARLLVKINPTADYNLQWTADSTGLIVGGANSQQVQVAQTGNYTLVVTNKVNGCSSSTTIRVGEPELPSAAELNIRHISCFGKNDGVLNIGSVTDGTPPYVFSVDGEPFMVSPEFRRLPPGEHSLLIQAIDGCEYDTTFTVLEPDDLVLTLDPDTTILLGQRIGLWRDDALSDPSRLDQLLVSTPITADMLCDTCMYAPINSFRYEVTVLDSNGCRATDDREIVVDKNRRVYIPNVFAPESPFENAVFRIFCGEDVAMVRTFRIYSRWGRAIVEQNDLSPNDPLLGWDGNINGDKASPAVFVYFAEIEFKDGAREQYRGDVTLVR
ncbi:MAG: gliding motility-associated C-terminal domain-containing protein [Saprospiraceae bacterium]|nr:gliding motility-associated C-terminal domain-containing protein [Lewinellaceae bacterium]